MPTTIILLAMVLVAVVLVWVYLQIKETTIRKERHPKKKNKYKHGKLTYKEIRKEVKKAHHKHYKGVYLSMKTLQTLKKEAKLKKNENALTREEEEAILKLQKKIDSQRIVASNKVYKIANSYIPQRDKIDLHGLFVGDAIRIIQERLPQLKRDKEIKTLRISCGVGNHNGLGYSRIMKKLVKILKKNKITQRTDRNTGFVYVVMTTVPDTISIDLKYIKDNTIELDDLVELDEQVPQLKND
ncbi:Smr domain-containing protein [Entamoeba marina]